MALAVASVSMHRINRRGFLHRALYLAAGALLPGYQAVSASTAPIAPQTSAPVHANAPRLAPFASAALQPVPTDVSLATKIGQMIMVGFGGRVLSMDDAIVQQVAAGTVGSVVLFSHNVRTPEQLRALTSTLHEHSPLPLLVAIDQEGGWVTNLPASFGIATNHSAQFLGAGNDLELTRLQGDSTAQRLAELGINLNLAPVVDLNTNPNNPIIGRYERSYSADPALVTDHARTVIESHRPHKVLCTLKHFPGHGSSESDTHAGFVDVTDTWNVTELAPYASLIGQHSCDAIMTAHIFNATLDPRHPATLSHAVLTGLLREKLGYWGVIISDDMQMGAIANQYNLETAIRLAIEAGVDIISFSNNLPFSRTASGNRLHDIILNLVHSGAISETRIHESYERIMLLKQKLVG